MIVTKTRTWSSIVYIQNLNVYLKLKINPYYC